MPLDNFGAARRAHPDAPADFQRLLMGMWPHAINQRPDHGGIECTTIGNGHLPSCFE